MLGYAKYVLLGDRRAACSCSSPPARCASREQEPIDGARWLRELEAPDAAVRARARNGSPRPMRADAPGSAPATATATATEHGGGEEIRRQVEQLADSDPDRVAQQLRTWMQEG